ncbi:MAG: hydrogenase expression/formation protein HypE [Bdellovibrionales bacterium]|jgi:hydrogenase expression/formation protein HypE|nr:hydrogenase expression/formation protein HypE [Bdellovibrionales bacterium]MBT3526148.1 hydrogenase expression/formation protein HypE [Bdellovibrionales bacterium]MBT7668841.1 hydrogenase expression/formation protein HypE [Bdellovibrionales bacterium]MBT7766299.1 hydrogenase expression/formation protein HypE [Bdellovibrionales bacterium]
MTTTINQVTQNHGSGGKIMHNFIESVIMERLKNGVLERMDDAAVLENIGTKRLAITTDSFVVKPLFFDGGDIGRLAVCGTVNDLATSGAKPHALTLSFILEEGVELSTIERIVDSIAQTAKEADVRIVTGDTKVVERGKGDQIYINTCGIGFIDDDVNISTYNAQEGDLVMINGPIGNHEMALLKARKLFDFEAEIKSDAAPLNPQVEALLKETNDIHVIKDPTRGGLSSALWEICQHSEVSIQIEEEELPIDANVATLSELVGYDPLHLSNEGKFILIVPPKSQKAVERAMGKETKVIGRVIQESKDKDPILSLYTKTGGLRRVGMLETTMLPRIC